MAKKKEGTAIDKKGLDELSDGSRWMYCKLLEEAKKLPSLLVKVISREGNEKWEMHPIVNAISQAAETYRRQLSEGLGTPKSKKTARNAGGGADGDDPMSKMLNKLEEMGDD